MSPELTAFYQAYNQWLEAGAPEEDPNFFRGAGLCANLNNWADWRQRANLRWELEKQFQRAELDPFYPFNNESYSEYSIESNAMLSYLNPQRVAWVKAHAQSLES